MKDGDIIVANIFNIQTELKIISGNRNDDVDMSLVEIDEIKWLNS